MYPTKAPGLSCAAEDMGGIRGNEGEVEDEETREERDGVGTRGRREGRMMNPNWPSGV